MRKFINIFPADRDRFRERLLAEVMRHTRAMVLESLPAEVKGSVWACVASFGELNRATGNLDEVRQLWHQSNDWLTGYIAYDYKNRLELLKSEGYDGVGLDDLCWVRPRYLLLNDGLGWQLGYATECDSEASAMAWLEGMMDATPVISEVREAVELKPRVNRDAYIATVNDIKSHIARGDVYEMNYCTEFYSDEVRLDAVDVYVRLTELSPMPFSALMKQGDGLLMCASPERYLMKRGRELVSEPIKGTCGRGATVEEDVALAHGLANNEKERAENIMIADLVRNDLSRVAQRGSVHVKELCGVKAFRQVHQMVSTIGATLREGLDWVDVIEATFPMGSMTGAPKVSAMQLIEQSEVTRRGLYSGTVGYVTPEGDFDLNVVIRSILYNRTSGYVSYITGSAITHLCDAEQEYEECLLKGKVMREVLEGG